MKSDHSSFDGEEIFFKNINKKTEKTFNAQKFQSPSRHKSTMKLKIGNWKRNKSPKIKIESEEFHESTTNPSVEINKN